MKRFVYVSLSILIVAAASCRTLSGWLGVSRVDKYFPLDQGNYWDNVCYEIDSTGQKLERKNREVFDSVTKSQDWWGRHIAAVRHGDHKSWSEYGYSFSNDGDLQMFVDTSFTGGSHLFDNRTKLMGYWQDVEKFSDSSKGQTEKISRAWGIDIRRKDATYDRFVGVDTRYRTCEGNTVVEVPAGRFVVQARLDSMVDSVHSRIYNIRADDNRQGDGTISAPMVFTLVVRRYYAADVGLVLERTTMTIPPILAESMRKAGEIFWTTVQPGIQTQELVSYRIH